RAAGNPEGAVLLDADLDDGTSLATIDSTFSLVQVANDSVPTGRTVTDVVGLLSIAHFSMVAGYYWLTATRQTN
ncbi:MAG: hypothetical protein AAFO89_12745, partial [Planctomycetota bacterium]